jgi:enoyl-[acyl-carrier protein] reductase/trans-2-enoyl-CoA reductase (NAD+)
LIVKPKIRGFICTSAHPAGCRENVREQIAYVKSKPKIDGPPSALVVGASMGYGLASRIAAAYGCGAKTVGVICDKPARDGRTGTAGWYNAAAFDRFAAGDGVYAKTINGDAFSESAKREAAELIKKDLGRVGLVVYSLAAPKRVKKDGSVCSSVIKAIGSPYTNKSVDMSRRTISEVTVPAATEAETADTVGVMGGEDWADWIDFLADENALAPNAVTVAYSYVGPALTHPMYKDGTIGRAKEHLTKTANEINARHGGVKAFISVNKALVTQSSSAIPVVPLYISVLYKIMKGKGLHEGCIEQMYRLFADKLFAGEPITDENGLIRMDDWEMRGDVQEEVSRVWDVIDGENLEKYADLDGYQRDFERLFGFGLPAVDYGADVEI